MIERGLRFGLVVKSLMLLSVLPLQSLAADNDNGWTGQSELGFVLTEGNTETQTLNGKLNLNRDGKNWRQKFGLEVLSASSNDETSAERYGAELQLDKKLSEKNFLFAKLFYDDDRFSGFDYETGLSVGAGRTLFKDDKKSLTVDAGPGFRYSKPNDAPSEEEAFLGLGLDYELKFSDTAKFSQTLDVDMGEDRTVSKSVTGLTSKMTGNLAMKLTLTIKHNSEPPVDEATSIEKDSTDTETAVTLVYSF